MRRLSPALLTMIMLGVVGLLVTLYFGKRLLATQEAPPPDPMINIPMALTDLNPGTRITAAHIGMGRAREAGLARETVRSNRVLIGRVVKNPITAAQPISTTDLFPPGEYPPPDISPGMRAVAIPVGDATALGEGMIQRGSYVDVHFTPANVPNADETGGMILLLFKGVKVMAVNNGGAAGRGGNTVTLELTPQQANIALLAKDRGDLNLTYTPDGKGTGVVAVEDEHRATLYEILGLESVPDEGPVPPHVTEIFSGTGRSVHQFREGRLIDRNSFGDDPRRNQDRRIQPRSSRPAENEPAPNENPERQPPSAQRPTKLDAERREI